MLAYDLVLIVLVAVAAFAAGYQIGRFKTLAERAAAPPRDDAQPLPGPASSDGPFREASAPRPAPPSRPRRSTTPPPAAAGLMGRAGADKPSDRQK